MNLFGLEEYTIKTEAEKYVSDFQTPPPVCAYMASLIPDFSNTGHIAKILEPTPGMGNIVAAIHEHFQKLGDINYNIDAPEDYFLLKKQRYDCILMNPPFSSKYAVIGNAPANINKYGMRLGYHILTECMEMSDSIIALMPWFTISDSDVRLRFLKDWGLKSLTALPRKTFQYARIQTVVIELQKGYQGETAFKVYDRLAPASSKE